MRVVLNDKDLGQTPGRELLALALRICADGKLDLSEIKELWHWLRNNKGIEIPAIAYLQDILNRVTADKVIDRDELIELQLAVERIIPTSVRSTATKARKDREKDAARLKKEREKEVARLKKEAEKEAVRTEKEEAKKFKSIAWGRLDDTRHMPLRFTYSNVAGISFMNDDFSERQQIAALCEPGEYLVFQPDPDNSYSVYAIRVSRTTNQQLGYVPESLAMILSEEIRLGYKVYGLIAEKTGGGEGMHYGINFIFFLAKPDVTIEAVTDYIREVYALEAPIRRGAV